MNKKIIMKLIVLGLMLGSSLYASDYQGLNDAGELMDDTTETMGKAIEFGSFIFGWILMLGFPIGGYYLAYKHFKEKDEQDRSGNTNSTMLHAKSGGVAIVALIAGSMIFTFIFVKTLSVDQTTGTAMKKVLKIGSTAFGDSTSTSTTTGE